MRDKFIIMLDLHVLNMNFEELFLFFCIQHLDLSGYRPGSFCYGGLDDS